MVSFRWPGKSFLGDLNTSGEEDEREDRDRRGRKVWGGSGVPLEMSSSDFFTPYIVQVTIMDWV